MAQTFPLTIVSPAATVYNGDATLVEVPGVEGDFGVLANHSPFFSMIRPGIITVQAEVGGKRFFVTSGYADVSPEGVTILSERALDIDTFDKAEAARQLEEAEGALSVAETEAEKARAAKARDAAKALVNALNQ